MKGLILTLTGGFSSNEAKKCCQRLSPISRRVYSEKSSGSVVIGSHQFVFSTAKPIACVIFLPTAEGEAKAATFADRALPSGKSVS